MADAGAPMVRVQARHILLGSREEADYVLGLWRDGADFGELATEYSECPTGEVGGLLGEFGPDHMPKEIDRVVFEREIGPVYGPVQSAHGFHLIQILERKELG